MGSPDEKDFMHGGVKERKDNRLPQKRRNTENCAVPKETAQFSVFLCFCGKLLSFFP
jgi:hypothetical protein